MIIRRTQRTYNKAYEDDSFTKRRVIKSTWWFLFIPFFTSEEML